MRSTGNVSVRVLWLVVGAIWFVTGGCSTLSPQKPYLEASPALQREIDDRVANLSYLRGGELIQNLRRLIWIGEPAIPSLLDALSEDDPKVRGAAAYALGEIGDPRVVKELRGHLDDRVPEVRYEVAASLVTIGDWNALPTLIAGLEDPAANNRNKCIEVLRLTVGEDFGFLPGAPEAERKQAVARWQEWWAASREGDLL